MSQDKPIDLEGLLDNEPSKTEEEFTPQPDFVDDPDSEFLPQESLDSIIEEEGEEN